MEEYEVFNKNKANYRFLGPSILTACLITQCIGVFQILNGHYFDVIKIEFRLK